MTSPEIQVLLPLRRAETLHLHHNLQKLSYTCAETPPCTRRGGHTGGDDESLHEEEEEEEEKVSISNGKKAESHKRRQMEGAKGLRSALVLMRPIHYGMKDGGGVNAEAEERRTMSHRKEEKRRKTREEIKR